MRFTKQGNRLVHSHFFNYNYYVLLFHILLLHVDEDFKIVGNNKDVQSFNLTLTSLRARSSSQVIEITRDQKYETAVGDARERFCLEITKVTYPGNDIQISQRTVGQFVNVDIIDINSKQNA